MKVNLLSYDPYAVILNWVTVGRSNFLRPPVQEHRGTDGVSSARRPAEFLCGCLAGTETRRVHRSARLSYAADSRVIHQHKEET